MDFESICRLEGLEFIGLVSPNVGVSFEKYIDALAQGHHAGLSYMENYAARQSLKPIFEKTQSILVFGLPYYLAEENLNSGIAQYAQFADYHKLIRAKATRVLNHLKKEQPGLEGRVVSDSIPLLERAVAARTFNGFIGKNTFFIHKDLGSYVLLGEILLNFAPAGTDREPYQPLKKESGEGCGDCRQCQSHCPTGALSEDYKIDSSKCLSYWTIEHRGLVPIKYWKWFEYYYFGCDICQRVCPYNMKLKEKTLPLDIQIRKYPGLKDIACMSEKQYIEYFSGSPLTRAKRQGLRRNALIALKVKADNDLARVLDFCQGDPDPVVQGTLLQFSDYDKMIKCL